MKAYRIKEWVLQIGLALIIFFGFLRPYVVEAFRIPTSSMERTLLVGDHLLVLKVEEGQFIPWTDKLQPLLHGFRGDSLGLLMPAANSIEIGDIYVFRFPLDNDRDFIKRAVALAGDTVFVRRDTLFVNGEPLEGLRTAHQDQLHPNIIDHAWPECLPRLRGRVAGLNYEELARECVVLESGQVGYVVPEHHIFMMGDNRDHSNDSRIFGPLNTDLVKGKALLIYWSWDPGSGLPKLDRVARLVR